LRNFRNQFAFQGVTTEDFQKVCEAIHGKSLKWFFDEWIYGAMNPHYLMGWTTRRVAGQDYLLLTVGQWQDPGIQRFTMPLEVRVDNDRDYVIWNDANYEHYVIPVPAPPTSVALDPDGWVLCEVGKDRYTPGPPTVVKTVPAPGQLAAPEPPVTGVQVYFHEVVNSTANDYVLVGERTGNVPLTLHYDPNTLGATLQVSGKLRPDRYTLTIRDSIKTTRGRALDGEVADPNDPGSLPTGDGQAGGTAVLHFAVDSAVGDLDCNGDFTFADINAFLLALRGEAEYNARYGYCRWRNADCNEDGRVDEGDIDAFVALLSS
jgi:hypothetical protein